MFEWFLHLVSYINFIIYSITSRTFVLRLGQELITIENVEYKPENDKRGHKSLEGSPHKNTRTFNRMESMKYIFLNYPSFFVTILVKIMYLDNLTNFLVDF